MLLILLSWIYILSISLVFGLSLNKHLKLNNQDAIITLFLGFFGVTLFAGFWAILFAIDAKFHVVLFLIIVILSYLNRAEIVKFLARVKAEFCELQAFIKGILCVIFLLILAQSASPPFLIDNESYYIQTIKWLNQFGFVNGLVNLHPFLGQTSGWHILQSAFNFSFLYERFNDLSGLVLLLGNVYAFFKLNTFITKKETSKLNFVFGLFPLWNIFFFQFISAPSPDVAIYVLSIVVIHQFALCYSNYSRTSFFAVVLLSLFITIIKLTGLVFCILPLILYTRQYIYTKKSIAIVSLFGSLTVLLFLIKNLIITGNLLFPFQGIESLKTAWSLAPSIEYYFAYYMQPYGYHLSPDVYENASVIFRLKSWLFAPIPHGLFNVLMIVLLLIIPFVLKKFYNTRPLWIIYNIAILNMLILFFTSPQYRFFIPFILIFSLLIASLVLINYNSIKVSLVFCTILAAIPMFFEVNNKQLTANKYHQVPSQFNLDYLVQPFKNSKYSEEYKTIQFKETTINSPTQIDFFWGTGAIPLPAVNQEQLDYFKTYFHVIPQKRTENLKDGFISIELK